MNNNSLIKNIIISQKNFHLLPRNEDNYCVYEGDLSLSGHVIKKLPENFRVDGNFYCSGVGLEELPNGLVITGEFNCYSNQLTKLPNDLVVLKDLYCFKNKLQDIPVSIVVNGTIFCYDNDMSIFRIINGNTKAIYDSGEVRKLSNDLLEIENRTEVKNSESTIDYQQRYLDRLEKEKKEKEEKERNQKELDEIKMSKLSDDDKSIYKRVIAIRDKRKNMTYNRYMYY